MSKTIMRKALDKQKVTPLLQSFARLTSKHFALAQAYGAQTGRFPYTPPGYAGKPYRCVSCNRPASKHESWMTNACRCANPQLESKEDAMQRRAHWLLQREFDKPEPMTWPGAHHVVGDTHISDFTQMESRIMRGVHDETYTLGNHDRNAKLNKTITQMLGDILDAPKAETAVDRVEGLSKGGKGGA